MSAEIAAYLRDLIMAGQLPPGSPLRLADLAGRLSVSTTPIREAILILEKEGFVECERHKAFRVKLITAADIGDLFELHAAIAGILAERATPLLTEIEMERLGEIDRRIQRGVASGDAEEVEEQNFHFHRTINRAPESTTLRRFLRETTRYVPRRYYQQIPGWLNSSAQDHGPILDALNRRDGAEVRRRTEEHIKGAGTLLLEHLRSMGLWNGTGNT
ncbi:MAG: GntR family transcriptional regulator [Candidatus Dormibacteraeota bacterium]|uniref:GntR family transcriptional regulator n=2 Tax=Candidatus Dormibacteria TaxID=3126996 RepID=A0A934N351_9BACT|nr:GntR family transcriptional regulator [Candidatus Dormibacteraeota bacterium]MBJ7603951.1 GntR family transcriptional regulator [Candidatus Dormibacteraeota bacterium]MBJ7607170.1 GntR family transcriptional regulator [Candidatus Dormibacteraeota bacterium]